MRTPQNCLSLAATGTLVARSIIYKEQRASLKKAHPLTQLFFETTTYTVAFFAALI